MNKLRENLQQKFPFISVLTYGKAEYVGIIINHGTTVTSFYDLNTIRKDDRAEFLEIGEIWWWESCRKIPITIFCKGQIEKFDYAIKIFNNKDVNILFGPAVDILKLNEKRVKRKSVQVIKKQ